MGDPDRVATLIPALEHVVVAYVLLGSATGGTARVAALHGSRLQMMLRRIVDTTVRGVVYEARGSVDAGLLREGSELVRSACEQSLIPYVLLDADPTDAGVWLGAATAALERVLDRP